MSKEIAIEVKGLSKSFRLPVEQARGIKQAVINRLKGIKGYKDQRVLRDISFNVERGDFFGIVGRNGSGKSTLLKLISNIYNPDGGSVTINGSLVSFIELGVGFNPELTGRENVYLNGALLGFSTKEIDEMYDGIVDFAELSEFVDQKLKNYSSGMQVRLAFSCAIRAKSDILVLDEVLAVGDEAFQRKCNDYFDKIRKENGKTVVLVTHSMEAVRKFCNRAMMIRDGKIIATGDPNEVADDYRRENLLAPQTVDHKTNHKKPGLTAKLLSDVVLTSQDKLVVEAEYRAISSRPVYIKFAPLINGSQSLMTANSKVMHNIRTADTKKHVVRYELPLKDFNYGNFSVVVLLTDAETDVNIADFGYDGELCFTITGSGPGGAFKNKGKVEFIR
jgi:ABC-2 type transport system ATP-binding protein